MKESTATEVPQANNASQEGIVALGVVFGVFAISMGTFIAYLIYREKRGRPSFAPQVSKQTSALFARFSKEVKLIIVFLQSESRLRFERK